MNQEEFDSNSRLNFLVEIEKLSISLAKTKFDISSKEEKKKKYKDLMSALKDGKVQKDMKFSHLFQPNIFLNLARKDSVRLTETEIEKLTKEISLSKNRYEVYKNEILEILIKNKNSKENNINSLEPNIRFMIAEEYYDLIK